MTWLAEMLADGEPHEVEMLMVAGKGLGFCEKTINRAKTKLKVKSEKLGFHGKWYWRLPDVDAPMKSAIPMSKTMSIPTGMRRACEPTE